MERARWIGGALGCGLLAVGWAIAQVPDSPRGRAAMATKNPIEGAAPVGAPARPPELTWDNLDERLDAEAADGFSGVVMVVRDGEVVVDRAFGMANRKERIPNRSDTIFAIGSTPIDFTHVGILMLAEQGKLSPDDPITHFLEDVPEDKRAITVDHLLTGRSGLRDFHGLPGEKNPDHPWIDRDEAMRRILAQELLFPPGEGRRHSHSAWGVLAAILEIASGESYEEFTSKRIFKPLGMKDTGFYGKRYPKARMAVGYGPLSNGKVNAPPFWGRTSWLVMGSGGQVSTASDMIRFVRGIHEGKLLSPEMRERLLQGWDGVLAGGDAFGFEIVYTADPDNMSIMISNFNPRERVERTVALGEALAELTLGGGSRPGFSLGIAMQVDTESGVSIAEVVPGSAAERDGLLAGDRLLSANGTRFTGDPMAVLDPLLATGERITFEVERQGSRMEVAVKPKPRS